MSQTFTRSPKHGWDPWLNDATRPSAAAIRAAEDAHAAGLLLGIVAGSPLKRAVDGFEIGLLPGGEDIYMSYVDNFGGWPALQARFGQRGAKLVAITIFGNGAHCADVESGAMHVSSLPHWLDHVAWRPNGELPWVYTSAGNFDACNAVIGTRPVIRWSAHYGFGPHVCGPRTCGHPQADWTQWVPTGPGGENYDRSVGFVVPSVKPVPPPDPMHYDRYATDLLLMFGRHSELYVAKRYDAVRALAHPSLGQRAELTLRRNQCRVAAGRIWAVVHLTRKHDWSLRNRGWRFQELRGRARGERLTPR